MVENRDKNAAQPEYPRRPVDCLFSGGHHGNPMKRHTVDNDDGTQTTTDHCVFCGKDLSSTYKTRRTQ